MYITFVSNHKSSLFATGFFYSISPPLSVALLCAYVGASNSTGDYRCPLSTQFLDSDVNMYMLLFVTYERSCKLFICKKLKSGCHITIGLSLCWPSLMSLRQCLSLMWPAFSLCYVRNLTCVMCGI